MQRYHAIRITEDHRSLIERLDSSSEPVVNWEEDQNNWFLIPEDGRLLSFVLTDMGFYARFGESRRQTHSTITIQAVQD